MNKETRIQEIKTITDNENNICGKEPLYWGNDIEQMNVFNIPLDYLIYNRYNGRILSRTKSIEKSRGLELNMEDEKDVKLVHDLLFKSNISRNNNTLKDIKVKGQLKTGIITRDGIIIDGNRRAMLLNELEKKEFRAIVLPIKFEDNPIKIEELETMYQMGEDEKLGYNPIEKYLKAKQIFTKLREKYDEKKSIEEIASWMGENESEIRHYLDIVDLIDRYLEYCGYNGIYAMADTSNDGKEDLFLHLKKWIEKFKGKESADGFSGYNDIDVEELVALCFDYIRVKIGKSYDGKLFRNIADGRKENNFFGNKDIWQNFKQSHFKITDDVREKIDKNIPIDLSIPNIEAHLSARDSKFRDETVESLENNIRSHLTDLGYKKASRKPMELGLSSEKAIASIDIKHESFSEPEVLEQISKIGQRTSSMLKEKSLKELVRQILFSLEMLEDINFEKVIEDKESALEILQEFRKNKSLEKIAYELEKKIKHLK